MPLNQTNQPTILIAGESSSTSFSSYTVCLYHLLSVRPCASSSICVCVCVCVCACTHTHTHTNWEIGFSEIMSLRWYIYLLSSTAAAPHIQSCITFNHNNTVVVTATIFHDTTLIFVRPNLNCFNVCKYKKDNCINWNEQKFYHKVLC